MIACLLHGCQEEVPSGTSVTGRIAGWLIPIEEVKDGGPGKDGIPSIDDPQFISVAEVDFLEDNDLVVGMKLGEEVKAYPHVILDWHEIVNDKIGDKAFALTYCPLTGSAIAWDRIVDGQETTFGVSGLLYNTNLIPYDRLTNSNWSQMSIQCVNGELVGNDINTYQVVETTWKTWKNMYPTSKILSLNTGYTRNYGSYPYGDYKSNHDRMLFQVNPDDDRLPRKDRVLGVINTGRAKVYRLVDFESKITVLNDSFSEVPLVVAGSSELNFLVAYDRQMDDGTVLEFSPVEGQGDIILEDNEGNRWNVFGEAVSGQRKGQTMKQTNSFIGYWMAWGAFYPLANIYRFQ